MRAHQRVCFVNFVSALMVYTNTALHSKFEVNVEPLSNARAHWLNSNKSRLLMTNRAMLRVVANVL